MFLLVMSKSEKSPQMPKKKLANNTIVHQK